MYLYLDHWCIWGHLLAISTIYTNTFLPHSQSYQIPYSLRLFPRIDILKSWWKRAVPWTDSRHRANALFSPRKRSEKQVTNAISIPFLPKWCLAGAIRNSAESYCHRKVTILCKNEMWWCRCLFHPTVPTYVFQYPVKCRRLSSLWFVKHLAAAAAPLVKWRILLNLPWVLGLSTFLQDAVYHFPLSAVVCGNLIPLFMPCF